MQVNLSSVQSHNGETPLTKQQFLVLYVVYFHALLFVCLRVACFFITRLDFVGRVNVNYSRFSCDVIIFPNRKLPVLLNFQLYQIKDLL